MTENRRPQTFTDGGQKALPKAISDAIDAYGAAVAGACANFDDGAPSICRAALERAIADHADVGKAADWQQATEEMDAAQVPATSFVNRIEERRRIDARRLADAEQAFREECEAAAKEPSDWLKGAPFVREDQFCGVPLRLRVPIPPATWKPAGKDGGA
jgi:hypothetical protein